MEEHVLQRELLFLLPHIKVHDYYTQTISHFSSLVQIKEKKESVKTW